MNNTVKANTTLVSNGFLWLGASISIAEVLTGVLFAPLGFVTGTTAIIIGHLIGCSLLYLTGLIGARTGRSAMDSVKLSFGRRGSLLFSCLNVLQLVGWTAVMVLSGAAAASTIIYLGGTWVWSLIIGCLILIWVAVGFRQASRINSVACALLFVLTLVLCSVIFQTGAVALPTTDTGLTFGGAVELAAAMPLSWLPLIADYTKEAAQPTRATLVSTVAYFFGSCWMFLIGMGGALLAGTGDIAQVMAQAGLGVVGLVIVVFSTVTTTFLDVWSAGMSLKSAIGRVDVRVAAVIVCVVGTAVAMFAPIERYEDFLTFIGSVFAPMVAILVMDHYIFRIDRSTSEVDWGNIALWVVGFLVYRLFMLVDTPVGNTLPTVLIVMGLTAVVEVFRKRHFSHVASEEGKVNAR